MNEGAARSSLSAIGCAESGSAKRSKGGVQRSTTTLSQLKALEGELPPVLVLHEERLGVGCSWAGGLTDQEQYHRPVLHLQSRVTVERLGRWITRIAHA